MQVITREENHSLIIHKAQFVECSETANDSQVCNDSVPVLCLRKRVEGSWGVLRHIKELNQTLYRSLLKKAVLLKILLAPVPSISFEQAQVIFDLLVRGKKLESVSDIFGSWILQDLALDNLTLNARQAAVALPDKIAVLGDLHNILVPISRQRDAA